MKKKKPELTEAKAKVNVEAEVIRLLAEIKEERAKQPGNWYWDKCYEIAYSQVGIRKHWALKNAEDERRVATGKLLLADLSLTENEIEKDETLMFIEKSLTYIDTLLALVDKLSKQNV